MKYLITIGIVFYCVGLKSQTVFLVYKMDGKAYKQKVGKKILLQVGNSLNESDSIILERNSSVKFICNNYSLVDLKAPHKGPVKKIANACKIPSNNYDAAYFQYIWEQLSHKHTDPENDRKKYMNNLGGAVRGCPGFITEGYLDTVRYYSGNMNLRWRSNSGVSSSTVALHESETDDQPIFEVKAYSSVLNLNDALGKGLQPGMYYWTVNEEGKINDCPKKYLEIWDSLRFNQMINDMREQSGNYFNPAELNYRIGFQLEREHFYADALRYYQQAVALEPKNKQFSSTIRLVKKIYQL